ncbi:MAG: hypothetical protein ACKVOL_14780 [Novosphingobium sp.]
MKAILSEFKGEIAINFKSLQIVFAALLIGEPVAASAKDAGADHQFSHQGVIYEYTTEVTGSERVIRGTAFSGKVPFELHVKGNLVSGNFDHQSVAFSQAKARALGIQVAAN